MDLRPGDKIFGPDMSEYTIVNSIGNGAFGIVYKVQGEKGENYALKTISTAFLDENDLNALINEGKLAAKIENPNVLKIIYFHDGNEYPELPPYILMDFADGRILQELLNQRKANNNFFSDNELHLMMLELASGMAAINEKLIHRDIKPDNILIHKGRIKIADFGLSKLIGAISRTQTFKGIHSLMYTAPEAWMLEKNTISMDIYSMGIVYYEIATLTHPYKIEPIGDIIEAWKNAHLAQIPDDPREHNPNIELGLRQIVLKMIAKRSVERYNSWAEIISRLKNDDITLEPKQDVSKLVEKALEIHRNKEITRLKIESEENHRKEHLKKVQYAFTEIMKAANLLVEEFNKESETTKLYIYDKISFEFTISIIGNPASNLIASIAPVYDLNISFKGKTVNAWGLVKTRGGHGFNLILLSSGPEDLYGNWITLFVSHSPLVRIHDNRSPPSPPLYQISPSLQNLLSFNPAPICF